MKHCPLTDPALMRIAQGHNVTTAQVCLRWILDRGCTIAVGTGSNAAKAAEYAKEDLDLFGFTLTQAELKTINAIGKQSSKADPLIFSMLRDCAAFPILQL